MKDKKPFKKTSWKAFKKYKKLDFYESFFSTREFVRAHQYILRPKYKIDTFFLLKTVEQICKRLIHTFQ